MFKQKMYVIAKRNYREKENFDFVSYFQTERYDYPDKVGYQCLEKAFHFQCEERAKELLSKQPKWIQEEHIVIPFTKTLFSCRLENI